MLVLINNTFSGPFLGSRLNLKTVCVWLAHRLPVYTVYRQTAELYLGIKSDFLFFMPAHSHRLQIPKGSFTLKSLLAKMREVLCVPLNRVTVLSNHPPTASSRRTDADCNAS